MWQNFDVVSEIIIVDFMIIAYVEKYYIKDMFADTFIITAMLFGGVGP